MMLTPAAWARPGMNSPSRLTAITRITHRVSRTFRSCTVVLIRPPQQSMGGPYAALRGVRNDRVGYAQHVLQRLPRNAGNAAKSGGDGAYRPRAFVQTPARVQ